MVDSTSVESTSGHLESPRGKSRRVKSLKATGRNTTESSDELNQERKRIGNDL